MLTKPPQKYIFEIFIICNFPNSKIKYELKEHKKENKNFVL